MADGSVAAEPNLAGNILTLAYLQKKRESIGSLNNFQYLVNKTFMNTTEHSWIKLHTLVLLYSRWIHYKDSCIWRFNPAFIVLTTISTLGDISIGRSHAQNLFCVLIAYYYIFNMTSNFLKLISLNWNGSQNPLHHACMADMNRNPHRNQPKMWSKMGLFVTKLNICLEN